MNTPKPDIKKLNSSWTKFDIVKVIEFAAEGRLKEIYETKVGIDYPVFKSFIGIIDSKDPFPAYWEEIKKYSKQVRLFSLVASLFTHHLNIKNFADSYSKGNMQGVLNVISGRKHDTNLRRALIISGAALRNYQNKEKVPYDLSALFEEGQVGVMFKEMLKQRLVKIGYNLNDLIDDQTFERTAIIHDFHKVVSLTRSQFSRWIRGESLNPANEKFQFNQLKIYESIPVLKLHQWLNEWDDVNYNSESLRRKPEPIAYMFKIDARLLKKLSDVHRRKSSLARNEELQVQRGLNKTRISEISSYIEGGFPWSTLTPTERRTEDNQYLKMPGFLPTAIIINILGPGENRNNKFIDDRDCLKIDTSEHENFLCLKIPKHIFSDDWTPELKPIEIIDGQHRLLAFNESQPMSGNFELPVIAYYNLDRAWQAYLFYTINIKPVKINTSLGYDLYPLLRTQEWLEKSKEGLLAYRETRAQEIIEALWNYSGSPWFRRINMIGETGGPILSQAAFIRALTNSFLKKKNGLFSSLITESEVLPWTRTQQAAFLILLWQEISKQASESNLEWCLMLRNEQRELKEFEKIDHLDIAFTSQNSFLSRDQGVRGICMFANDFFFSMLNSSKIKFDYLDFFDQDEKSITSYNLDFAIENFKTSSTEIYDLIILFAKEICKVDWRTPSAVFLNENEREKQLKYKGGSGYTEIYNTLKKTFESNQDPKVIKVIQNIN